MPGYCMQGASEHSPVYKTASAGGLAVDQQLCYVRENLCMVSLNYEINVFRASSCEALSWEKGVVSYTSKLSAYYSCSFPCSSYSAWLVLGLCFLLEYLS